MDVTARECDFSKVLRSYGQSEIGGHVSGLCWHTACRQKETDWHRFDWPFTSCGVEPSANKIGRNHHRNSRLGGLYGSQDCVEGIGRGGQPGGDGRPFDAGAFARRLPRAPCDSCRRPTSRISIRSGAPSMSCATPPRWCGTRSTASTTSCSRSARWSSPRRCPTTA